jgi:lipopolysaccharide transport system ATP-binding protein
MKSDVIYVDQASKHFKIYAQPFDRIKQLLLGWRQCYYQEYVALKSINLTIQSGESVALIGRNGSGKSTLLQLICQILQPTAGRIVLQGRIAALLELGSGFNPEFTGRENIFLNAAIYGLSRSQIKSRIGQILDFADIGEFIDQPIKTYSSGMQLRLAFAVIAHVDADILIVDEALAVGDAVFTQKCMRFIREFSQNKTLLFVSHDPALVQNLCTRAVWLEGGTVKEDGNARDVCRLYLLSNLQKIYGNKAALRELEGKQQHSSDLELQISTIGEGASLVKNNILKSSGWTTDMARIVDVQVLNQAGEDVHMLEGGEEVCLNITAHARTPLEQPILGFMVRDRLGQDLFGENTLAITDTQPAQEAKAGDFITASFGFRMPMLPNGEYAVTVSIADGTIDNNIQHEYLHEAMILVVDSDKVRWGLVGIEFREVTLSVSGRISA